MFLHKNANSSFYIELRKGLYKTFFLDHKETLNNKNKYFVQIKYANYRPFHKTLPRFSINQCICKLDFGKVL